jgi:hypothetical protein
MAFWPESTKVRILTERREKIYRTFIEADFTEKEAREAAYRLSHITTGKFENRKKLRQAQIALYAILKPELTKKQAIEKIAKALEEEKTIQPAKQDKWWIK